MNNSHTISLPVRPGPRTESNKLRPFSSPQEPSASSSLGPQNSCHLDVSSSAYKPGSTFLFGAETNERAAFSFRDLHNASPQPPNTFQRPPTPQRAVEFQGKSTPNSDKSEEDQQLKSNSPVPSCDPPSFTFNFGSAFHSPDALEPPRPAVVFQGQREAHSDKSEGDQQPNSTNSTTNDVALSSTFSVRSAFQSTGALESEGQIDSPSIFQLQSPVTLPPPSNDSQPTPYDVRDEAGPDEPFYTVKFQSALKSGMELAKDAQEVLERFVEVQPNSTIGDLKTMAEVLSKYQNSDTKTIAVLGDSGEGRFGHT
jgi:hypothetical protein